jgi:hypothetical protein
MTMTSRSAAVALGCSAALVLAGCGGASTAGKSASAADPRPSTSSPTRSIARLAPPPKRGAVIDGHDLSSRLETAMRRATYVRVSSPDPDDPTTRVTADVRIGTTFTVDMRVFADGVETMRFVDGVFYLRNDKAGSPRWYSASQEADDPEEGGAALTLNEVLDVSPTEHLETLPDSTITFVAREGAANRTLDHYRVRTSLALAIDREIKSVQDTYGPGSDDEKVLRKAKAAAKGKSVTTHLWLSPSDDLPRKVQTRHADFGEDARGTGSPETLTATYGRWRVPVKFVAPPASQTKSIVHLPE